MAATVDSTVVDTAVDRIIVGVQLSAINPGATETITFPAATPKVYPHYARLEILTPATSGDPVFLYRGTNWANGGTNTGQTLTIKLDTIPAGNLAGAVVRVIFEWLASGAGGITS